MKITFAKFLAFFIFIIISSNPATAVTKIPNLEPNNGFLISKASEVTSFLRAQDNWVVAGSDSDNQSWLALYDQKGSEIWRIFPISIGNGGAGFITAAEFDSREFLIAGVSQRPIELQAVAAPEALPSASPSATSTSTPTATKSVPLVNPDNVVSTPVLPLRKDIDNLFFARVDLSGKIVKVINTENKSGFLPNSIAVSTLNTFLVGNEMNFENRSRGAIWKFNSEGYTETFVFGDSQTVFNKAIATSTKSLTIIGTSAETIAQRKVVGKSDGIILTITVANGKVSNLIRSSGNGALRTWDSASGNLQVAGTSRVGGTNEAVITSFTSKRTVAWSTRISKSVKALINGNCVATENTSSDAFIHLFDGKGKQVKIARLARQEVLGVGTTPSKGCALLSVSSAGGVRVSSL